MPSVSLQHPAAIYCLPLWTHSTQADITRKRTVFFWKQVFFKS